MEILNKNIEAALEELNAGDEDKRVLKAILYKEHINRGRNWDNDAPGEIKDILHSNISDGGEDD